jgi:hypothetical protein
VIVPDPENCPGRNWEEALFTVLVIRTLVLTMKFQLLKFTRAAVVWLLVIPPVSVRNCVAALVAKDVKVVTF